MVTFKRGIQFVAVTLAATMVLTGCIPGNVPNDAASDGKFELYMGAIPAPAELIGAPAQLDLPTPPTDFDDEAAMDEYSKAMEKYADEIMDGQGAMMNQNIALHDLIATARKGGEPAVSVWQTLLVTAGLAVANPNGGVIEVNEKTGFGFPITDPELRLHSAMSTATGGIRLTELARAIAQAAGVEEAGLAEALHDDLTLSASTDAAFSMVFYAAGPEIFGVGIRQTSFDEAVLRWDQAGLLLRRLSAELTAKDAGMAMPGASASSTAHAATVANITTTAHAATVANITTTSTSGKPCDLSVDPYAAAAVEFFAAGGSFALGKALEHFEERGSKGAGKALNRLALAGVASAIATLIIKVMALSAEFTLADAPLVRTKTNSPGEVRDLRIKFSFNKPAWEDIRRCLNLFAAFTGIQIPALDSGAAEKIGVDLSSHNSGIVRVGDGAGGSKSVNKGITNKDGEVQFKLSGAPYREKIPEKASPNDITVRVTAESNLEGNDFMKDMVSAIAQVASISAIGLAIDTISRMRWVSHSTEIPVRDWVISGKFRVTLAGTISSRTAWNRAGGGCLDSNTGPGPVRTGSVEGRTVLESREPVDVDAILISDDYYYAEQVVVLVPTKTVFAPAKSDKGYSLFDMKGGYTTTKTLTEPETQGLPPFHQNPPSPGCGDGPPSDYVPPPSDCGKRLYDSGIAVKQTGTKTLIVDGESNEGNPWKVCGLPLYPMAAPGALDACGYGKEIITGGRMPSIDDVYDASKTTLTVEGSLLCTDFYPGTNSEMVYDWTLTLCRLDEEGRLVAEC